MSCPKCQPTRQVETSSATTVKVALVGNPNVGKSTLFNLLTGANQHVGNWPSKTVAISQGSLVLDDEITVTLVDLPGTYSISGFTDEEFVTKEYLIKEHPDLIVLVTSVDTLSRNLYLALQIIESFSNVVLVINKEELLTEKKLLIEKFEQELGIPCLLMSAHSTSGIDRFKTFLQQEITKLKLSASHNHHHHIQQEKDQTFQSLLRLIKKIYSPVIVGTLIKMEAILAEMGGMFSQHPQWFAFRLLENDPATWEDIKHHSIESQLELRRLYQKLKTRLGEKPLIKIVSARYRYIDLLNSTIWDKNEQGSIKNQWQDQLDRLFLNTGFQLITTVLTLFTLFWIVFEVGALFQDIIAWQVGLIREQATIFLENLGFPSLFISFLLSELGVLGAIDALLQFIPLIVMFFLIFTFLEHSGVLARFAYSLDRLLSRFGLQGRAFFPMTMSVGCNVVGIYNTKILENRKIQLFLSASIPYIPCSGRLPVLAALLAILVNSPTLAALFLFSFIFVGYLLTTVQSWILSRTSHENTKNQGLILELPTYNLPPIRYLLKLTWIQTQLFLQKAGKIMVLGIIAMWILAHFPPGTSIENSILGWTVKQISWVFAPLDFDWRAVTALIFGIVAKENALVVLQALYGGINSVPLGFTFPSMMAFLVFFAYYTPCLPTIAALRQRLGSWKLTLATAIINLVVAFLIALTVHGLISVILTPMFSV